MLYDKDIREGLFSYLEDLCGKVRIIEEKNMGASRADAVMITGEDFCGIEIKSDADTYTRLKSQIGDYDLYFDRNCIVVGSRHALHVREHIPEWWGIITVDEVDGRPDFYLMRKPEKNPRLVLLKKLSLLWRPELAHIQSLNGLPAYKWKSKRTVMELIASRIPYDVLRPQMSEELFQRDYTAIQETINKFRTEEEGLKPRRKKRKIRRRSGSTGHPDLHVSHIIRHKKRK